jgi:hypothetical protein
MPARTSLQPELSSLTLSQEAADLLVRLIEKMETRDVAGMPILVIETNEALMEDLQDWTNRFDELDEAEAELVLDPNKKLH